VPPANFTLPRFKSYSEAKWFWRISEGIPGTRMPRWKLLLNEEQRWYLVRWLQYLSGSNPPGTERLPRPKETTSPAGAAPAAKGQTAPAAPGQTPPATEPAGSSPESPAPARGQ